MKDIEVISYSPENSRTVRKTDSIVDSIIDDFIERSSFGKKKYGTNLDRKDLGLDDWITHSIEEAMDLILYLRKIQTTIRGSKK
jgi:hypothetical protein